MCQRCELNPKVLAVRTLNCSRNVMPFDRDISKDLAVLQLASVEAGTSHKSLLSSLAGSQNSFQAAAGWGPSAHSCREIILPLLAGVRPFPTDDVGLVVTVVHKLMGSCL